MVLGHLHIYHPYHIKSLNKSNTSSHSEPLHTTESTLTFNKQSKRPIIAQLVENFEDSDSSIVDRRRFTIRWENCFVRWFSHEFFQIREKLTPCCLTLRLIFFTDIPTSNCNTSR